MYEPCKTLKSIALFDFDGTLYLGDSFTRFIFYALNKQHILLQGLKIVPWIKGYYLNLYTAPAMRKKLFASMFTAKQASKIQELGRTYAPTLLPKLNPILLAQLRQHQALGHDVVLVSASLDIYLKPICDLLNIDLICSEPEIKNGLYTGEYAVDDCSSYLKKINVMKKYNLDEYENIYAYGNSDEDLDMLSLAHHSFLVGKDELVPVL